MPRERRKRRRSRKVRETFSYPKERSRSGRSSRSSSSKRLKRSSRHDPGYGRVRSGGLGGYTGNQFKSLPPTSYGRSGNAGAQGPQGLAGPQGKAGKSVEFKDVADLVQKRLDTAEAKLQALTGGAVDRINTEVQKQQSVFGRMATQAEAMKKQGRDLSAIQAKIKGQYDEVRDVLGRLDRSMLEPQNLVTKEYVDHEMKQFGASWSAAQQQNFQAYRAEMKNMDNTIDALAGHLRQVEEATKSASVVKRLKDDVGSLGLLADALAGLGEAAVVGKKGKKGRPGSMANLQMDDEEDVPLATKTGVSAEIKSATDILTAKFADELKQQATAQASEMGKLLKQHVELKKQYESDLAAIRSSQNDYVQRAYSEAQAKAEYAKIEAVIKSEQERVARLSANLVQVAESVEKVKVDIGRQFEGVYDDIKDRHSGLNTQIADLDSRARSFSDFQQAYQKDKTALHEKFDAQKRTFEKNETTRLKDFAFLSKKVLGRDASLEEQKTAIDGFGAALETLKATTIAGLTASSEKQAIKLENLQTTFTNLNRQFGAMRGGQEKMQGEIREHDRMFGQIRESFDQVSAEFDSQGVAISEGFKLSNEAFRQMVGKLNQVKQTAESADQKVESIAPVLAETIDRTSQGEIRQNYSDQLQMHVDKNLANAVAELQKQVQMLMNSNRSVVPAGGVQVEKTGGFDVHAALADLGPTVVEPYSFPTVTFHGGPEDGNDEDEDH